MMCRKFSCIVAILAGIAVAGLAPSARAQSVDFNVVGTPVDSSGTVSYAGGSTDLVGSGLASNYAYNTSSNTTAYFTASSNKSVQYAAFSFTTGAYTGSSGGVWNFSSTSSSITVTGDAYSSAADTTKENTTSSLLSGSFTGTVTVTNQSGNAQQVVGSAVLVVIDSGLASYLGVAVGSTVFSGSMTLTLNPSGGTDPTVGSSFSDSLSSGNITVSATPAPSSAVLVGCGVAAVGGSYVVRRRKLALAAAAI
jgi:hypothetical protein